MGDAAAAGIAAGHDGDAHFFGFREHILMGFDDFFEVGDDGFAPPQFAGEIDLGLDGGEGGDPGDAAVAHFGELFLGDEKAVFDGVHAAFDGVFDALGGGVGERLAAIFGGGGDEGADFVDGQLRPGGDAAFLEIDDAADEEFDAVGAFGDARGDDIGEGGVLFDGFAHKGAVAARWWIAGPGLSI